MRTVVFRTYLVQENIEKYYSTTKKLQEIAVSVPGFIAFKNFVAPDGEEITIVEFESEEALTAWRDNPEHLAARKISDRFFTDYRITTFGEPLRDYGVKNDEHFGEVIPR